MANTGVIQEVVGVKPVGNEESRKFVVSVAKDLKPVGGVGIEVRSKWIREEEFTEIFHGLDFEEVIGQKVVVEVGYNDHIDSMVTIEDFLEVVTNAASI